jgi:hypothetical protein
VLSCSRRRSFRNGGEGRGGREREAADAAPNHDTTKPKTRAAGRFRVAPILSQRRGRAPGETNTTAADDRRRKQQQTRTEQTNGSRQKQRRQKRRQQRQGNGQHSNSAERGGASGAGRQRHPPRRVLHTTQGKASLRPGQDATCTFAPGHLRPGGFWTAPRTILRGRGRALARGGGRLANGTEPSGEQRLKRHSADVSTEHPPVPTTRRHGGARRAIGEGRDIRHMPNVVAANRAQSVSGYQHDPPERCHRP